MKTIVFIVIALICSFFAGGIFIGNKMNKIICEKQAEKEKFRIMYDMMDRWMRIKQRGENLQQYFHAYGYSKIAIYGMSSMGKLLLKELEQCDVEVLYGIDKNKNICDSIEMYTPDDELKNVDAIVVTAIAYYDDINNILKDKVSCRIISLEDIVYEIV